MIAASTVVGGLLVVTGPAALTAGSAPSGGSQAPFALTGASSVAQPNSAAQADSVDFLPTPRTVRSQRSAPPSSGVAGSGPVGANGTPVVLTSLGIPEIVLNAYRSAELVMMTDMPGCGIPWHLLAGIGRIESGHANGGRTDSVGTTVTPILGPVLDGRLAGNEVIADTDKGAVDGDPIHDRAVGPMQFIPATWAGYASDGNGDGVKDPNNVFDAALASAKYLCSGGLNLRDPAQETRAVLRYNNSAAYAANVMMWSTAYQSGVIPSGQLPYTSGIDTGSSAVNASGTGDSAASAILAAAAGTDPTAERSDAAPSTTTAAPPFPGVPDMPALSPEIQALIPPGVVPVAPAPAAPRTAPRGPVIPLPVLTSRGLVWPILTPTGWRWPDDMCVVLPDPVALDALPEGIFLPCTVPGMRTAPPPTDDTAPPPAPAATTTEVPPPAAAPAPEPAPAPPPAPAPAPAPAPFVLPPFPGLPGMPAL